MRGKLSKAEKGEFWKGKVGQGDWVSLAVEHHLYHLKGSLDQNLVACELLVWIPCV